MSGCTECDRGAGVDFTCSTCRRPYCYHHRHPSNHDCPGSAGIRRLDPRRLTPILSRGRDTIAATLPRLGAALAVLLVTVFVAGLIGTGIPAIDEPSGMAASGLSELANASTDDGLNHTLVEQEFLRDINEERQSRGLGNLSASTELREMGQSHARNMRDHDYIGHTQPDGTTIEDRYQERSLLPECRLPSGGNRFYNGPENVAGAHLQKRVTHPGTTRSVYIDNEEELAAFLLDSWMSSEGHRRVMLLESANEIGLGFAVADDGEVYAAFEFC